MPVLPNVSGFTLLIVKKSKILSLFSSQKAYSIEWVRVTTGFVF